MIYNIFCLVHADNTILAGTKKMSIEAEIKGLGVSYDEHRQKFGVIDEGEVGDFPGIRIEKTGKSQFHLTHTGIIQKLLTMAAMIDCNSVLTPTYTTTTGIYTDCASLN